MKWDGTLTAQHQIVGIISEPISPKENATVTIKTKDESTCRFINLVIGDVTFWDFELESIKIDGWTAPSANEHLDSQLVDPSNPFPGHSWLALFRPMNFPDRVLRHHVVGSRIEMTVKNISNEAKTFRCAWVWRPESAAPGQLR